MQAIIDKLKPLFSAESTVNATYTETIKQDNIPVKFTLVDKNGKPLAESNDWDGDGVDNETEIKDCKNPLDPNDQNDKPKTIADETTPDWKDTSTKPGEPVDVPNTGDKLPEGSKVTVPSEVEGWKVELQPDGETIKVTPPADAKKDDKVTVPVEVTYPDGSKDTDEFTVTVTDADKKPNWDDASTTPKTPVDVPKKEGSGDVPEGSTVEVDGPGTAELKPDGTITVTPSDDAKVGDEIIVTVKDKNGKEIDKVTVTIEGDGPTSSNGPSSKLSKEERDRCIAVSVGFGLPLIALVPLGLAMSMSIPGLTPVVEQVSNQIQRANSELQRQLGVFNPEAARMSAQLDATLRQFGLSTAQVGSALAALIIGITAAASIASACTPGNGSSIDEIEGALEGGSVKPGSSKQNNRYGSSVKTSTVTPSAEAKPSDEAKPADK